MYVTKFEKMVIGMIIALVAILVFMVNTISNTIEENGGFKDVAKSFVIETKEILSAQKDNKWIKKLHVMVSGMVTT